MALIRAIPGALGAALTMAGRDSAAFPDSVPPHAVAVNGLAVGFTWRATAA
jgi:hypothetical protein